MELKQYANLCRIAYDRDAIVQYSELGYTAEILPTSTSEQVYHLRLSGESTIVIAGTNQLSDWLINLFALPLGGTWDVHPGYAAIAVALYPQIVSLRPQRLKIIGHSKGGAIAALLGAALECEVVSFGAPRLGSERFALHYPDDKYIRVVSATDIVARLPSRYAGYRHCGRPIVVVDGNLCPGEEAWAKVKGDYSFGALFVNLIGSIHSHFEYWD